MELAQQSLLYAPTITLGQQQGLPQLQGMYRQSASMEGGLPELESSYGSIHRGSQETAMVQQSGGMGYGGDMGLNGHGLAGQQWPGSLPFLRASRTPDGWPLEFPCRSNLTLLLGLLQT